MTPQPRTVIKDGTEQYRIVKHEEQTGANRLIRKPDGEEPAIYLDREEAREGVAIKKQENPDNEYTLLKLEVEEVVTEE